MILNILMQFCNLIAIAFGISNRRYLNHPMIKVFLLYLIFSEIIEIGLMILAQMGTKNHFLVNIFSLGTFSYLASLFFYYFIRKKDLFYIFWPLFIIVLLNIIHISEFNNILLISTNSLTIFFSGYLIIRESNNDNISIVQNAFFWINAGMLIYFFSTLSILIMFNYMTNPQHKIIWTYFKYFNFITTVFSNSLYIKGFLCCKTMKY